MRRLSIGVAVLLVGLWILGRDRFLGKARPEPDFSEREEPEVPIRARRPPAVPDPMTRSLARALEDIVLGRLGLEDRAALALRIEELLEEQMFGTQSGREQASAAMAERLLENAVRYRGATPREALDAPQRAAIEEIARDAAARLRRRFFVGRGETQHAGTSSDPRPFPSIPAGFLPVDWNTLGGFAYVEGAALPEQVAALQGRPVALFGHIIPLEGMNRTCEFLLVESLWSCCFGVPPAVNQGVLVRYEDPVGVDYSSAPFLVLGSLEVGELREDGFVTSIYRLRTSQVQVHRDP